MMGICLKSSRITEEVFRQAKRSDKPPSSAKPVCPVNALDEHFKKHFDERGDPLADDLKNPEKLKILQQNRHPYRRLLSDTKTHQKPLTIFCAFGVPDRTRQIYI